MLRKKLEIFEEAAFKPEAQKSFVQLQQMPQQKPQQMPQQIPQQPAKPVQSLALILSSAAAAAAQVKAATATANATAAAARLKEAAAPASAASASSSFNDSEDSATETKDPCKAASEAFYKLKNEGKRLSKQNFLDEILFLGKNINGKIYVAAASLPRFMWPQDKYDADYIKYVSWLFCLIN